MKIWFLIFAALHVRKYFAKIFEFYWIFQAYKRDNAAHNDHGSLKPQSDFDQVTNLQSEKSFLPTLYLNLQLAGMFGGANNRLDDYNI